jgi:hypothetical protein
MESMIRNSDTPSTLTCTPWGSGNRIGIDRDGDSIPDFEELMQGSDTASRESTEFRASSGLWFNPDRSGAGMDLQFGGGFMVMIWFTYNEDGSSNWYQAVGPAGKNWTAELTQMHWDPQAGSAVIEEVGMVSITFSDTLNGQFDWQVGNQTGQEIIKRLHFSTQATALPFTGLWFDPLEPGYGLSIDTQGDTRVVLTYFYNQQNQPRWVMIQQENSLSSTGDAFSLTGPCPWCDFVPASLSDGGSMTLDFSSLEQASTDFKVYLGSEDNGLWERHGVTLKRFTEEASPVPVF